MPRLLTFLQSSRASIEAPFGLKIDFANAIIAGEVKTLPDNLVQPGTIIPESGSAELDRAAREATEQTIIVIDLEDGQAWYWTRLFAVAATGVFLGAPKTMVLIGQRGNKLQHVAGWLRVEDLVHALTRQDPRYEWVWRHAQGYIDLFRRQGADPTYPPEFPSAGQYQYSYTENGDTAIMGILVHQMKFPDQITSTPAGLVALEVEASPPWVNLTEAESKLDAWLNRDKVDLSEPEKEQVNQILDAEGGIAIAVRNGRFAGVIDVQRAERQVLKQLAERTW